MTRVTASAATRKRINDLIHSGGFEQSDLLKEAMRLIMEEALEAEVTTKLGRQYNAHGETDSGGQRSRYRVGKLKSAEGAIEFSVPQVRGIAGWQSEVRQALGGRTEELEKLAVEMVARGLSMRDIEAAFTDTTGQCVLTRSAASKVAEVLWQDYQAFAQRSLSDLNIVYLFVDGVAEKLHLGQRREAVLAAWGIDMNGIKHLLGLQPGTKEDTATCRDFLRDLKARGMNDPVLVASDGAPGLIRAIDEVFPQSLRQRCLAHKLRNLQSKVPEDLHREIIPMARNAYQASSPTLARMAREEFVKQWRSELPTAVACFEDDFDACIAHLQLPVSHRRVTRTTNLLERLFLEERRRTKTIPHAFGERAVVKLMFAAIERASKSWKGVPITQFEQRQILALQQELKDQFIKQNQPVSLTATRSTNYSKNRT
jgi:putative transposase